MGPEHFESAYRDMEPWIPAPQPVFVRLEEAGKIRGSVLDVGVAPARTPSTWHLVGMRSGVSTSWLSPSSGRQQKQRSGGWVPPSRWAMP